MTNKNGIQEGDRVIHLGTPCCGHRKNEVFIAGEYKNNDVIKICGCGYKGIISDRFMLGITGDVEGLPVGAAPHLLRKLPKEEPASQTLEQLIENLNKVVA